MTGNAVFLDGPVGYSVDAHKGHVVVSCHGKETYQLTHKTSGEVMLAAFESSMVANRFFADNKDYFFSKLF